MNFKHYLSEGCVIKHEEICKRLIAVIKIFNKFNLKIRHELGYDQRHLFFFL